MSNPKLNAAAAEFVPGGQRFAPALSVAQSLSVKAPAFVPKSVVVTLAPEPAPATSAETTPLAPVIAAPVIAASIIAPVVAAPAAAAPIVAPVVVTPSADSVVVAVPAVSAHVVATSDLPVPAPEPALGASEAPKSAKSRDGELQRGLTVGGPAKEVASATSGWVRGKSTPADAAALAAAASANAALAAQSAGIAFFSKKDLLAMFTKGAAKCPSEYTAWYPLNMQRERVPLGLPRAGGAAGNGSSHTPRGGGRGRGGDKFDEVLGPHPDEAVIFSAEHLKDDSHFKYKPNKVEDENDPDVILRKANLILNQLSVEKFDKLSDRFMACGIDRSEMLITKTIDMIVMKAQLEEHFCFMYADLCRKIIDMWTDRQFLGASPDPEAEPPAAVPGGLGKAFRTALLVKCEQEFMLDRVAGVAEIMALDIPADERDEKVFVYRKRYLGHMRFVGEVFIQDLVGHKIMITCVDTLVASLEEDSLACLCKLMQTIGKRLEELAETRSKVRDPLEALFANLARMAQDTAIYSSRMRFLFRDLIDLRANRWVSRMAEMKATKLSRPTSSNNLSIGVSSSPLESTGSSGEFSPSKGSRQATGSQDVRKGGGLAVVDEEWESARGKKGSSKAGARKGAPSPLNVTSSGSGPSSARGRGGGGSRFDLLGGASPKTAGAAPSGRNGSAGKGNSSKRAESASSPKVSDAEPAAVAPSKECTVDPSLYRKIHSALNEFYQLNALEEVMLSFKELDIAPEANWDVIRECISAAMEKKADDHKKLGGLFASFASSGFISSEHIVFGTSAFLEHLTDIKYDSPKADEYLGIILGNAWVRSGLSSLEFIMRPVVDQITDNKISDIVTVLVATVETIFKETGLVDAQAREALTSSRVSVEKFREYVEELDSILLKFGPQSKHLYV